MHTWNKKKKKKCCATYVFVESEIHLTCHSFRHNGKEIK